MPFLGDPHREDVTVTIPLVQKVQKSEMGSLPKENAVETEKAQETAWQSQRAACPCRAISRILAAIRDQSRDSGRGRRFCRPRTTPVERCDTE